MRYFWVDSFHGILYLSAKDNFSFWKIIHHSKRYWQKQIYFNVKSCQYLSQGCIIGKCKKLLILTWHWSFWKPKPLQPKKKRKQTSPVIFHFLFIYLPKIIFKKLFHKWEVSLGYVKLCIGEQKIKKNQDIEGFRVDMTTMIPLSDFPKSLVLLGDLHPFDSIFWDLCNIFRVFCQKTSETCHFPFKYLSLFTLKYLAKNQFYFQFFFLNLYISISYRQDPPSYWRQP